jgi:hypothetical protein
MTTLVRARLAFGVCVATSSMMACSTPAPAPIDERTAQVDESIINGQTDTTHPAVVAYLHDNSSCSATIIAVKGTTGYALTAAHCIGASNGELRQGNNYNTPTVVYQVTKKQTHPGWPYSKLYDVGMLSFSGASASTPVIPASGASLAQGAMVDMVGYGLIQDGGGPNTVRYHKTMSIGQVTDLQYIYNQSAGGMCSGDSGGPSLNGNTVAGVHRAVGNGQNPSCLTNGSDMRVSAFMDTFITPYINFTSPQPQTCAQCTEAHVQAGVCSNQLAACTSNADCQAYQKCIQACSTNACYSDCANKHQTGAGLYGKIFACVCNTGCPNECGKASFCSGPQCGLSYKVAGCQSCMDLSCCSQAVACSQSNTCLSCVNSLVPGPQCATDPTTVAYNKCQAAACEGPCGVSSSSSSSTSATTATGGPTTAATTSGVGTGAGAGGAGATVGVASSSSGGGSQETGDIIVENGCTLGAGRSDADLRALALAAVAALVGTQISRRRARRGIVR